MNAEIDNYATDSDAESEYSEYSEYSDDEESVGEPDILGPILSDMDGLEDGTEADLTEAEFTAEATSYLQTVFGYRMAEPVNVGMVIDWCRGARFWIIDEYNDAMHGHFLGPVDEWDSWERDDAYINAIFECVSEVHSMLQLPAPQNKFFTKYMLSRTFMDSTNVDTPRREVLWMVKELGKLRAP